MLGVLVETVVIEGLVDWETYAAKAIDFHDVIAEIVEDEVLGEVGHHLVEE